MSVLVLCPTRGRPDLAAQCLASFLATRRDTATRLVFIVDTDDPTRTQYPREYVVPVRPTGCMGGALAAGAKIALGDASVVGMIGDDNRFCTPGWDVMIAGRLEGNPGIVYGDDGFQHERLPTAWWLSRALVDAFGMTHPGLRHYYMDNYWLELGRACGCIWYMPEVSIEHLHPIAGKAENDPTYDRSKAFDRTDTAFFRRWRAHEKARDVRRLAAVLRPERRRVLADWHHPALWESLRLLFEVRFGWDLYAPYGDDWLEHGWGLTGGTPGWDAERYLDPSPVVAMGDHLETPCPEYPGAVRRLVTWDQASAQRWDYVVASVSCHQAPFARLAKTLGARFVHQVGNARHPIDHRIPQITLASARLPRGVRGVQYHQEFSAVTFRSEPCAPDRRADVGAFMLRLDATSGPYRWLADAIGDRWHEYGGTAPGEAGYLAPMSAVGDAMRASGWIWHDKTIGDGYGHVLHNAAAVGRPLIGHASHYRGMLGAPFWQDLRTCVDLDVHEPAEALRLYRAISNDPDWHAEMCDNIADRFRELVDFEAEAATIRRALE
jgi:hypothetical protein